MIETLHHRGPDGYGFYDDADVGLAHARLAIIDPTGGAQPIHNEDRSVWVVFNGEIFNYLELRQDLSRRGHCFYTHSDTEVIVHLYEEYGLRFLDHLNGQFAIALWDRPQRRLVLARDRTGIRPLYYTRSGETLRFASEVKALQVDPRISRRLDPHALAQVFTYWAPLAPTTVFADVAQLPPGHVLTAESGRIAIEQYWDWSFPDHPIVAARPIEDHAEELRELLIDAVRLQLRADVPVGAYLSGGLDSAVIASIIKNFTQAPLRTFSLTFDDPEFDESRFQGEMVQALTTEHTALRCEPHHIGEAFPLALWHAETPVVRTAPIPLMLLSGAVRRAGYKVVLTGEGADEVFGGYDLFKEAKVRRFCARVPGSRVRPAILRRLYPYLKHSPASAGAFARRFFMQGMEARDQPYFAHMPRWTTTQRLWQFFSEDMRASLAGWDPYVHVAGTLPAGITRWPALARDQYVEARTLLSGYLLASQGDRVAMANSIEARFPFLDHRVIEYASRLPTQYKIHGLNEKLILKKAMAPWVPAAIRSRIKQPYRAPDSQSFFRDGKGFDYVEELLSESSLRRRGYFEPKAVRMLYEKCRRGRAIGFVDNMAFVGILSTMLIDAMFIQGESRWRLAATASEHHIGARAIN